jgi:hypothetical protein
MDLAELAPLVPVALNLNPPSIDWGDLGDVRFSEPFFDQTVERWAGGAPPPRLLRTGLDALEALDAAPSLEPTALIFHLSRCGSTLLSRLLATLPETLVIAEPRPLNTLLMSDPAEIGEERLAGLLRSMVRALGRHRLGTARHYILKLSSWNIARLAVFRRAFPGVPLIWLQRTPVEVMGSVLADPPGWLQLRRAPRQAELLFGLPPAESAALDDAGFCGRALAAMLVNACRADDAGALLVDYRELPEAIWTRIAPALGLTLSADEIARMRDEARFHSKDPRRRPFTGDAPEKRAVSDTVRRVTTELVEPLYAALDRRRRAMLASDAALA